MQLHIISKSPYSHQAFNQALALIAAEDYVLLIDDGVYAVQGTSLIQIQQTPAQWLVLGDDLIKRGLPLQHAVLETIDMPRFVQLSLSVNHCVSWY